MDKKLLLLSVIFLIAFLAFSSYVVFQEPLRRFTRAANEQATVSVTTSLIFAWPLSVVADGKSASEISVFVRDSEGRGIPNKRVLLETSFGTIQRSTVASDQDGKAIFSITSPQPGIAQLEATVDSNKLRRTVSVMFE